MREDAAAAPRPKRLFKKRWMTAGAVAALAAALWVAREPIVDSFLRDQFDGRGIPARHTIDEIGLSTQRLTDVVTGDRTSVDEGKGVPVRVDPGGSQTLNKKHTTN